MFNEASNPSKIQLGVGVNHDDFTSDAIGILAKLDAHGDEHIALMLRFGETVARAKNSLGHGKFTSWCSEVLRRSPSWVSAHRRLFEARDDLEPARAWAAENRRRWANCCSVDRLLKIVTDWKKSTQGDRATAPRAGRKKRAVVAQVELEEIAAGLSEILAEAEEAFETFRYELWLMVPPDDGSAKEELVELGKRFRSRLRELGESCGAPQLSKMAEAVSDDVPHVDDAPKARLLQ